MGNAARAGEDESGQPQGVPDHSVSTSVPPVLADPGDIRRALADAGVQIGVSYTGGMLGNVSGGMKQSTHYAGLLELYTDIDFEKLSGWRELSFHTSVYQTHGTSISGANLGSLASVSNIEAYPSSRLFELWFEQKLLNDKVSIRFGQLAADAEFFIAEGGGNFINSSSAGQRSAQITSPLAGRSIRLPPQVLV